MLNELKGLTDEALASSQDMSYLRKEDRISQLAESKDFHISAAIATFQTNNENKSRFPKFFFWFENYIHTFIYVVYLSCDFVTRIIKNIHLKIGKSSPIYDRAWE